MALTFVCPLDRNDCHAYGVFPEFANGTDNLPPWRLSKEAVKVMDSRVCSMWWAHYTDMLCEDGHSFWTHSDKMYKSIHKFFVLMVILPTCLKGYVPKVHAAILVIVNALRRLDGQVLSVEEATKLGVELGSRVIDKDSIPTLRQELIRGLVLLEGSFPVGHLNPAMHHLVHYGFQTLRVGLLRWFAMYAFERNNKRIKGMVRNNNQVLSSLANNIQRDIATRFQSYSKGTDSVDIGERPATCIMSSRGKRAYKVTKRERFDLNKLGITRTVGVRSFTTARILGVHFKTGGWGKKRCGSVVTTVHAGRSRYCVVQKFLQVQGQCFARVMWLSVPTYPCAPSRVVVRVKLLSPARQTQHRTVIPVNSIDPCSVHVLPDEDGVHFFMMRDKGVDRVRR